MFTKQKPGPSVGPGGVRSVKSKRDGKLWQSGNERARAGEKPIAKNRVQRKKPKADPSIKSEAATGSAGNANAGGDNTATFAALLWFAGENRDRRLS